MSALAHRLEILRVLGRTLFSCAGGDIQSGAFSSLRLRLRRAIPHDRAPHDVIRPVHLADTASRGTRVRVQAISLNIKYEKYEGPKYEPPAPFAAAVLIRCFLDELVLGTPHDGRTSSACFAFACVYS